LAKETPARFGNSVGILAILALTLTAAIGAESPGTGARIADGAAGPASGESGSAPGVSDFKSGAAAGGDEVVVVEVGRVITLAGEDVVDGKILIEGGRIRAIGKSIDAPFSAKVHRFPQGVAMPGLIACHSSIGLRAPNEVKADVPFVTVLDGIDPAAPAVENALRDGIAVANVVPLNATRFGGQGAVIRLRGRTVAEMLIRSPSGMKISLDPPRGETRMGNMAAIRRRFRELFLQMRELSLEGSAEPAPRSSPPADLEEVTLSKPDWGSVAWDRIPEDRIEVHLKSLVDLVRGKMPAYLYCGAASDVYRAFELTETQRLQGILVLGPDAYKLAKVLPGRKEPAILDPRMEVRETDPDTNEETLHWTPRVLFDAGVRFALQAMPDSSSGPRFTSDPEYRLNLQAALLVRWGIPRDEALKAVTLTPARILALDHRMGTLEPGKDGNVTVFSGDPLDARSWVDLVLIEGEEAYRRDKDRDLELLLKGPERSF
jgi:imidazolonepropionase-like amidohydrolase